MSLLIGLGPYFLLGFEDDSIDSICIRSLGSTVQRSTNYRAPSEKCEATKLVQR